MKEGDVLGDRYRLEGLLGQGGMGCVYRGHDLVLDRPVALKVPHEWAARKEDLVARFRREARTGLSLSHPSLVRCLDKSSGNTWTCSCCCRLCWFCVEARACGPWRGCPGVEKKPGFEWPTLASVLIAQVQGPCLVGVDPESLRFQDPGVGVSQVQGLIP